MMSRRVNTFEHRTRQVSRNPLAHAATLGLVHALVDAATVTAVFRTTRLIEMSALSAFWVVVAYNLIAFGLQPLVGWCSDRWRLPRWCLMAGLLLPMAALLTPSTSMLVTVVLAGLGNALFHVGAGVLVLSHGLDKTAPAGVFVGPGALGLAFGIWYGRDPGLGPSWPLALLLFATLLVWGASRRALAAGQRNPSPAKSFAPQRRWHAAAGQLPRWIPVAIVLLLLSVTLRALIGSGITREVPRTLLLLLGAPLAACAGKVLGGFIADRVGWLEATSLALLSSAPLIVLGVAHTPLLLLGLLVFQTTMPVTLIAVARALPRLPGVAFGLPCLALVIGSLPAWIPGAAPLLQRSNLLGWSALALASVLGGLWLLGLRPRLRLPSTNRKRAMT